MSNGNKNQFKEKSRSKKLTILFPILTVVLTLAIILGGSALLTATPYFYLLLLVLAIIWNAYYAIKHLIYMKRVKSFGKGLIVVVIPAILSAITAIFCFFPWFFMDFFIEMWYLSTWFGTFAVIFVVISCVFGLIYKPTRLISGIILIYSCFALSIIIPAAFASLAIPIDNPVFATLARSNTLLQMWTANGGAIFHPLFISPLFCIKFNSGKSFSEFLKSDTSSFLVIPNIGPNKVIATLKMVVRRGVLLWIMIGISFQSFWGIMEGVQNITGSGMSTYHLGHPSLVYQNPGKPIRTIAVAHGPADKNGIRADWSAVVDEDIRLAKLAGINILRWHIYNCTTNDQLQRDKLQQAVDRVHAEGLNILFVPRGLAIWEFGGQNKATPTEYWTAYYHQTLDFSINFAVDGDWVLPFLEPNTQGPMQIEGAMSISDWKDWFSTVITQNNNHPDAKGKIVAGISAGPNDVGFIEAIAETNIDAIGLDIYPFSSDVSVFARIAPAFEGYSGERWITEFGVETIAFGEQAQANMISLMMSEASQKWNANGFCVWALTEYIGEMPSHLGLFRADGTAKPVVVAFKAVVEALQS